MMIPTAQADNPRGMRLAPVSIVRGQAVQFNVYHEHPSACQLRIFFSYGTKQRFFDGNAPVERVITFQADDPSCARKLILSSDVAFADTPVLRRRRLQAHAIELGGDIQFSPAPQTECGPLRMSLEIYDEVTGINDFVIWDREPP